MPPALASREYKLMLRAARFAGAEAELIAQVAAFWRDFNDAVAGREIATDGALTLSKERPVTFYDTADRHLNNKDVLFRDYVFRAGRAPMALRKSRSNTGTLSDWWPGTAT